MSSSLALPFSHLPRFPNVSSSRASSAFISPSLAPEALASASAPGLSLGAISITNSSRQRSISHIGRAGVSVADGGAGVFITDGGRDMHLHGLGMKLIGRGPEMGNPRLLFHYMGFVYSKTGVNADNSGIKNLNEELKEEENKIKVFADCLNTDPRTMTGPQPHRRRNLDWLEKTSENNLQLAFGIYVDDSDVKKLVEKYNIYDFADLKYEKELIADTLNSAFPMTVRLQILHGKRRGTDLVSLDFDTYFCRWLQEFNASEPTDPLIQKFVSLFEDQQKLPEGVIVLSREEGYVLRMRFNGEEVGQTQGQHACMSILKPFLKKSKNPNKAFHYLFT